MANTHTLCMYDSVCVSLWLTSRIREDLPHAGLYKFVLTDVTNDWLTN